MTMTMMDKKLYFHVQLKEPYPIEKFLKEGIRLDKKYQLDSMWCVANRGSAVKIEGMNHPFPREFTCVSVGSTVYVIGGWHFNSVPSAKSPLVSDLWFTNIYINNGNGNDDIDVDSSSSSSLSSHAWTEGAPMKHPRYCAYGVAVDDKIYVFGGGFVGDRNPQTWAEVYDIKSNSWSSLPTSPPDISYCALNCALLGRHLILVNIVNIETSESESESDSWGGSLYSYDVLLGNWEILDSRFGIWAETQLATVVVSTTPPGTPYLVTFKDWLLHAYNLSQKKWTQVNGLKPGIDIPDPLLDEKILDDIRVVSLGENNICVLWAQYRAKGDGITVYCSNLTLYEEEKDDHCGASLVTTLHSRDQFEFQMGCSFMTCLAIATTNIKRKKEGELQEKDPKRHKC